MRYAWLAIIAVSLAPVAVVAFFANPLVFVLLGPEVWRHRLAHLHPHRRRLAFCVAVCAFATTVYGVRYG
jgi:hypothetical protein